jgi:hypothetical protein
MRKIVSSLFLLAFCGACGGGGGSSSEGTVLQGTLIERGNGHASASVKHSAGQSLEDVKVCVMTECSITDGQGQWGVNIDNFTGGDITVTVDGHGIDAQTSISLPPTARDVELNLAHNANAITVEKLVIDGEDHSGHDHSHS